MTHIAWLNSYSYHPIFVFRNIASNSLRSIAANHFVWDHFGQTTNDNFRNESTWIHKCSIINTKLIRRPWLWQQNVWYFFFWFKDSYHSIQLEHMTYNLLTHHRWLIWELYDACITCLKIKHSDKSGVAPYKTKYNDISTILAQAKKNTKENEKNIFLYNSFFWIVMWRHILQGKFH